MKIRLNVFKKKKGGRHTCGLSHNMLNQQIIGDSNLIPSFIHVKRFQSFFFFCHVLVQMNYDASV
jgi:hypothetical protein